MKENTNIAEKPKYLTDKAIPFDAVVGLPTINVNEITLGDSLELCERIPAKTVDLILEDMPYNTTACEWDVKIDLELYWKTRLRILKPTGAIVLFADEPFTSVLICSNKENFKYRITWDKDKAGGFLNAKIMPMKQTEDIILFALGRNTYNPIMKKAEANRIRPKTSGGKLSDNYGYVKEIKNDENYDNTLRYPTNIITLSRNVGECNPTQITHPTQKPVGLFEYLIRTYSNEGDLVFDGFGGSGTTAIACHKSKRNFIVIEKEQKYFDLATRRLDNERTQLSLL